MRCRLFAVLLGLAAPANAEVPHVAADILPVHSLVARIMQGVGEPDLILPPGASPHGHAMRPSEAAALERADVVFWIGEGLTPWLDGPISTLATDAEVVTLLDKAPVQHETKEGDDHDHAEHDHGEVDPHAWLDPENGRAWLDVIAATLARVDPENAAAYKANAEAARAEAAELAAEMETTIAPLRGREFAVYHDALEYVEARFGVTPRMTFLSSDADRPGPRRIAELRKLAQDHGVDLVLVEPLADTRLIETVLEAVDYTLCSVDPLGSEIPPGPSHYWATLSQLAAKIGSCAAKQTGSE